MPGIKQIRGFNSVKVNGEKERGSNRRPLIESHGKIMDMRNPILTNKMNRFQYSELTCFSPRVEITKRGFSSS
ncbi:hypothetical protein E4H04_06270 [Candidatus Bathyarchaeota archaeon]|nr:MAG: hypothetical protein E4H04_06270 [Candidatus Bathyarchaeota archaeon]